jgi:3-methyl-2-oxobutanoate hydroxymethyltransferase
MLGLFQGNTPSFAKKYVDLTTEMKRAFVQYHQEVLAETFPTTEHERKLDQEIYEKLISKQ